MSRPSDYSENLASKICEMIADGKSLRSICQDDDMPAQSTVFKWLGDNSSFSEQYAHAREAQADALFDEILHISNTPVIGEKVKVDAEGKEEVTRGDMIEHRRLQIDARKWMAGKLRPKKYGDRLDVDLNGNVGFVVGAKPVTEEQWLQEHGSGAES